MVLTERERLLSRRLRDVLDGATFDEVRHAWANAQGLIDWQRAEKANALTFSVDHEPTVASQAPEPQTDGSLSRGNTDHQGSSRTQAERMDLTRQVFERCKLLGLPAPLLSDLDAFLEGRTSAIPPVIESESSNV